MNWIERVNTALEYVESNLTDRLDIDSIATISNMSTFHFQKMFHILADVTLAEYIRKRRLTLAAIDIMNGESILDVAVKYGYETQASFTRAYKRIHGFTPGMTRETGLSIKAYPPLTFDLTVQGESPIDYEVKAMGEFTIAGEIGSFTSLNGQNYKDIPVFWDEFEQSKHINNLRDKADPDGIFKGSLLGACLGFSIDCEEFNYMIGLEPRADVPLDDLRIITVPATTWAIFKSTDERLKSSADYWKIIYGQWFPATDYIHDEGPQITIYPQFPDRSVFTIYLPVKIQKI